MLLPLNHDFLENGPSKLNSYLPEDIRVLDIRRATPSFHAQKTCDCRTYSYTLPTYTFAPCVEVTFYNIKNFNLLKLYFCLQ